MLVKAVAQAIPAYAMSCFYLTRGLCKEISAMIGKFWWSQMEKQNTIHWIGWPTLTKPKALGGLGFRDIHDFNIAMLSRQAWRLIQNPESLCARILRAKYFPDGNILQAQPRDGISYSWGSILHGLQLVKEGCIWRIGDGQKVKIWSDPWIPRAWSRTVLTPKPGNLITRVCDLICPITGGWDVRLVNDTFWPDDAKTILQIPLRGGTEDFLAWHFDSKGEHSVRSAYKLQVEVEKQRKGGSPSSSHALVGNLDRTEGRTWKRIWELPAPNKVRMFMWRVQHESLALRVNLTLRGMKLGSTKCLFCGRVDEDGGHLFTRCKAVKAIWRGLNLEDCRQKLEMIGSAHKMLDHIWSLDERKRVTIATFNGGPIGISCAKGNYRCLLTKLSDVQ